MYTLHATQRIPVSIQQAWMFFASTANLSKITPVAMKLTILTKDMGESIYTGQIIEYKVRPLFGIPLRWITEITRVEEDRFFIDEQRKGPYSLWRHGHYFKPVEGGVEMTDEVSYKIPYGLLGNMANALLVKNKIVALFTYRFQQIEKELGSWKGQKPEIHFIQSPKP